MLVSGVVNHTQVGYHSSGYSKSLATKKYHKAVLQKKRKGGSSVYNDVLINIPANTKAHSINIQGVDKDLYLGHRIKVAESSGQSLNVKQYYMMPKNLSDTGKGYVGVLPPTRAVSYLIKPKEFNGDPRQSVMESDRILKSSFLTPEGVNCLVFDPSFNLSSLSSRFVITVKQLLNTIEPVCPFDTSYLIDVSKNFALEFLQKVKISSASKSLAGEVQMLRDFSKIRSRLPKGGQKVQNLKEFLMNISQLLKFISIHSNGGLSQKFMLACLVHSVEFNTLPWIVKYLAVIKMHQSRSIDISDKAASLLSEYQAVSDLATESNKSMFDKALSLPIFENYRHVERNLTAMKQPRYDIYSRGRNIRGEDFHESVLHFCFGADSNNGGDQTGEIVYLNQRKPE